MKTDRILMLVVFLALSVAGGARAQTTSAPEGTSASSAEGQVAAPALPQAPPPQPASTTMYHPKASASYISRAGTSCGVGASTSPAATKPTGSCGVGITLLPFPIFFEAGVMTPQANRSYLSGYISVDGSIPLARPTTRYLPLAIVGYSRLFETGHALDYGLALALPRFGKHKETTDSLRIELRDYWTFANPAQHNVLLRIGWMGIATD